MSTTHYLWDVANDSYLMEKDETGATTAVYTNEPAHFGRLISQQRSGAANYYHFDAQHSARQLTDQDQNVTDEHTFSTFGQVITSSGATTNPFGYQGALGYYSSFGTDDHYARARIYSSRLSRWYSEDRLRQLAGPKMYMFLNNNPANWIDHSGLLAVTLEGEIESTLCGGYKTRYRIDPSMHDLDKIIVIQQMDLWGGKIGICEGGCECEVKDEKDCGWCRMWEVFVRRRGRSGWPSFVDAHDRPPFSRPGCTSYGNILDRFHVRVFYATDEVLIEVATKFNKPAAWCQNQCVRKPIVSGTDFETGQVSLQQPSFWNDYELLLGEDAHATIVDWWCCGGRNYQRVTTGNIDPSFTVD